MSQNLFDLNARKSRNKALIMTIMFHVVIIGGVIFASPGGFSDIQQQIDEWMQPNTDEKPVSMT